MLKRPQDGGPIQDGYLLNSSWSVNPGDYSVLALAGLDTVRRANQLQAKWLVLPEQSVQIAARDTYEFDASVVPGSILHTILFAELASPSGAVTVGGNALLRITDACTGLRIIDDFAFSRFGSPYYGGSSQRGILPGWILPSPYMVIEPGRLFIEIANQSASAINARLVLQFAEPCDMSSYAMVAQ